MSSQSFDWSACVETFATNLRLKSVHFVPHVLDQFLEITYQHLVIFWSICQQQQVHNQASSESARYSYGQQLAIVVPEQKNEFYT